MLESAHTTHLDLDDPRYRQAGGEILRRHEAGEAEANITSAVRDFLILTGLAEASALVEENPPSDTSRRAVDLTALDTFIEFKRRIGTAGEFVPDPANVRQLDDYLAESQQSGKGVRTGILTDGRYWLLRWPQAGPIQTVAPYGFTLESPDGWLPLYEWLRDTALVALDSIPADRSNVEKYLGPASAIYQRDIDTLSALYAESAHYETIKVKRRLWFDLLRAALGEIAHDQNELDGLFIRHTYLSLVIGMAVQASFRIDIRQVAENDPSDLIQGRRFRDATGLIGIIESDFFAWPDEVGGRYLVKALANRVARFDWDNAPAGIAAVLYETVIPPEERRTLGEYYTPAWLAKAMVRELITDPLQQRVMDPACGSGTFIAAAVTHFLDAANTPSPSMGEGCGEGEKLDPKELLDRLRQNVIGIDVHPVAVHLARAAWALAARPAIDAARESGFDASGSVPVFLGDALQLRYRTGDLFAEHTVSIETRLEELGSPTLAFPMTLVERADTFDSLMSQVAADIERGDDPMLALDDYGITDAGERATLKDTIATLQRLHDEGRNHIWAYYTRNLVRPVALSRAKVDVVIGNPPWLNYNQTASILREELRDQSWRQYGIWQGGHYATQQDVAGLFFARSVDLYLRDGGVIGMVLPHSALQSGQYAKWRSGKWERHGLTPKGNLSKKVERTLAVDLGYKPAWDLEQLDPNTFFPVASCVAFGKRAGENAEAAIALAGTVERWLGQAGAEDVRRASSGITDTSVAGDSPYVDYAHQGASIRPRRLFFVEEIESSVIVQAGQTLTVNPRRGGLDKVPWKDLDLTALAQQSVEKSHVYDVHLGETVVPYATLEPLKAILPVKRGEYRIPADKDGPGGIHLGGLERMMRRRWQTISQMWDENKAAANKLNLLEDLDHYGKLSSQLDWQQCPSNRQIRVVQTEAGGPTAAILLNDDVIIDETLYRVICKDIQEAYYLLAIINSDALYEAVIPLMAKGQFGARHLHKHLWKLPIPEYDNSEPLHHEIAEAGAAAALGASVQLSQLRAQRGASVSVTIARRELRAWLRNSPQGAAVEGAVGRLLSATQNTKSFWGLECMVHRF